MEVLTYNEVVSKIMVRLAKRREDLSLIKALLEAYDNPHLDFPTIHIAGTNGKGQVAAKVYRALSAAGYRVGLFISPHIFDFAERITIGGEKIPKEKVVEYYCDLESVFNRPNLQPNFFECTTLFGFRYFQEKKVDIAVIETGLGGRRDSTNLIKPLVSCVTSVSSDHIEVLGGELNQIAREKAGIIKEKTPVVIGPRAKYPAIFEEAQALNAPIKIVEKQSCYYDTENQAVAKEVLAQVSKHFPLSFENMKEGLQYSLPCRFEKRGKIIYDVAHNSDGFNRLVHALNHLYPYRMFRFVIGFSKNKDIKSCLTHIDRVCEHAHFVKSDPVLGAEVEDITSAFKKVSTCPYTEELSIKEGVENAKAALKKGQLLVVCGSFFLMREAYR